MESNCRVRLIKSIGNAEPEDMNIRGKHLHAPDARELEKKRVLLSIKNAAKHGREQPRRLIADSVANLTEATAAIMPSTRSMARMVGRIRNQINFPKNPSSLTELVLDKRFTETAKGDNFLLYDSGTR